MSEPAAPEEKGPGPWWTNRLIIIPCSTLASYGLALALDCAFGVGCLVADAVPAVISIDRVDGILGWFVGVGIVVLCLLLGMRVFAGPRMTRILALVLAAAVFAALGINWVSSRSEVDFRDVVSGRLSAPNQLVAYLFVRPIESEQCWLQAPVPLVVADDGHWRAQAFFSGASGQVFETMAVAVPMTIDAFSVPGAYDCDSIPENAERAVRVVSLR